MSDRTHNQRGSSLKALPRYRRAEEAPGMVLQERDFAIVEDVWHYRCLTTSQIETLRGADTVSAQRFASRLTLTRRLKLLFHHRYLHRIVRPSVGGSLEPVYVLDREGARILSLKHGDVKAKAPSQQPKTAALEHLLAIAQMRVALTAACGLREGVRLLEWRGSDASNFRVQSAEGERVRNAALIPDGFFVLHSGGQRLFFFLEMDLGTEPQKTLAEKAAGYFAYWKSGGFAQDYGVPPYLGFRVLFVLPTAKRLQVALKAAEKVPPKGQGMFWMALDSNVTPETLLGAHWSTTSSQQPMTLIP